MVVAVDLKAVLPRKRVKRRTFKHAYPVHRDVIGGMPVVVDFLPQLHRQVLVQCSPHQDVHQLDTPADPQDRKIRLQGPAEQPAFQAVPPGADRAALRQFFLLIEGRVNVVPSCHEQAVAHGKQLKRVCLLHLQREDHPQCPGLVQPVQIPRKHPERVPVLIKERNDADNRLFPHIYRLVSSLFPREYTISSF